MGRGKSNEGGEPLSIRISAELRVKIDEAAKALGISAHDTIRQSMKLGLRYLRSINYDIEGVLIAKAEPSTLALLGSTIAEDPVAYGKGIKRPA